ncbi:MAG: hypothetical protein OHK0022_04250 [Roseiflexaceae bacterium]
MSTGWDLAIHDRDNKLVLVVEVKSIRDTSSQWAARLRRNILAHGTFPNAPYFLLACPDRFYLWKNIGMSTEPIEPTHIIDAIPVLQPYFEEAGVAIDQVSGQSFELIVASWLVDIIHKKTDEIDDKQNWIIETGLYNAVTGGNMEKEVVA